MNCSISLGTVPILLLLSNWIVTSTRLNVPVIRLCGISPDRELPISSNSSIFGALLKGIVTVSVPNVSSLWCTLNEDQFFNRKVGVKLAENEQYVKN